MNNFKIRASQASKIMGVKGLGKTGESYCEQWYKEQLYKRRYEFSSKYTEKGNKNEDEAISIVAEHLDYGMLFKNEEFFQNEYLTGTPDVITSDHIIDIKNSWDCFTFPLFEVNTPSPAYYWQAQCYMNLVGIDKYKLIYVLTDTPLNLIEREAYYKSKELGFDETQESIFNEYAEKMQYNTIPYDLRVKVFDIEYNKNDVEKIYSRVDECRNYLNNIKIEI